MDSKTTAQLDQVSASQLRAARALLGWAREEAAQQCGVARNTIARFESGERIPAPRILAEIVRVFESNGVVFVTSPLGTGALLRPGEAKTKAVQAGG